jgi:predicted TIM-barrel fold metal-dependent hydrolase
LKVDVHCYVGQWAFRRLPYTTLAEIRTLLARTETRHALVTPMSAIFYKDCLSATRQLYDELAAQPGNDLSLVAVVNPAFPGWRDDLSIMIDQLGCIAVQLFPNYHNYLLTDEPAQELLDEMQRRGLPLMLSPRMEDERLHHWLAKIPPVSGLDLRWLLRAFPRLEIVLCNLTPGEVDVLHTEIVSHPQAFVDTSARMPQFFLEEMVGKLGADRVLYGTGLPLQYPECTWQMIADAQLTERDRHKICFENAVRVFNLGAKVAVGA